MRPALFCLSALAAWLLHCAVHAQDPQDMGHVLSRVRLLNGQIANAARLALERGEDDDVRDYGERLWRDHRFANRRVRKFADAHDVTLEPYRARTDAIEFQIQIIRQYIRLLHHLEGGAFDRTFLDLMQSLQSAAARELQTVALQTKHDDLRAFLRELAPIFQQHTVLAGMLRDRLG